MSNTVVMYTDLPALTLANRGKVRDIYDLGEHLLIVATDRISAFDVVMPNGIPDKGRVLTAMTLFWFRLLGKTVRNHLVTADVAEYPAAARQYADVLQGRSMLVRKAKVLQVECVVRGYLAGSGWKEYRDAGVVAGHALPAGLRESEALPQPIFTPATKAASGHDINITPAQAAVMVGEETAQALERLSLQVYDAGSRHARAQGIILADTKFEFGMVEGELTLVDEVMTPDSSRFWDALDYEPGRPQDSFDKQPLRDWLEALDWNKEPPAPMLPDDVVAKMRARYLEAYRRITGEELR